MSIKLSKDEITNLLPHREPMLLIDELIDIVKLKSARAIVNEDIVGETKNIKMPRHAKSWGDGNKILDKLNQERSKAIKAFKTDVQNSNYPNSEHTISMDDGELDKLINELNKE